MAQSSSLITETSLIRALKIGPPVLADHHENMQNISPAQIPHSVSSPELVELKASVSSSGPLLDLQMPGCLLTCEGKLDPCQIPESISLPPLKDAHKKHILKQVMKHVMAKASLFLLPDATFLPITSTKFCVLNADIKPAEIILQISGTVYVRVDVFTARESIPPNLKGFTRVVTGPERGTGVSKPEWDYVRVFIAEESKPQREATKKSTLYESHTLAHTVKCVRKNLQEILDDERDTSQPQDASRARHLLNVIKLHLHVKHDNSETSQRSWRDNFNTFGSNSHSASSSDGLRSKTVLATKHVTDPATFDLSSPHLSNFFRVVFVQVGSGTWGSTAWKDFRASFKTQALRSEPMIECVDRTILTLPFDGGVNDFTAEWYSRIRSRLDHVAPGRYSKVLLVVAPQDKQDAAAIRVMIKKICDVGLGLQSCVVSALPSSPDGFAGDTTICAYSASILRKIRARNPPPSTSSDTFSNGIALGLHVSLVAKSPCVGKSSIYIVSMVSRSVSKSEDYRTSVTLLQVDDLESPDLSVMYENHTGKDHGGEVTIYRSGHIFNTKISGNGAEALNLPAKNLTWIKIEDISDIRLTLPDAPEEHRPDKHIAYSISKANSGGILMLGDKSIALKRQAKTGSNMGSYTPTLLKLTMKCATEDAKVWTGDEIDNVLKAFGDGYLGLDNCKFPIPTHLARLAAKRALLHLNPLDFRAENATAPFSLPLVHENLRDVLYYL